MNLDHIDNDRILQALGATGRKDAGTFDHVVDDRLMAALEASIARRTSAAERTSLDNYHCLASPEDAETVPDAQLRHLGGDTAEEFYSVPIDMAALRRELAALLA